ncbi:MAG: FecR domain-containing protein, partial [Bdellovibrionales bacterium]|nr:FecR domain-containing protein [Bdellovibrionales bacterium]
MKRILALILLSLSLLALSLPVFADDEVARVYSMNGTVEGSFGNSSASWEAVQVGTIFKAGDAIRVGKHGRAGILFVDGMLVRLSNSATIRFKPVSKTKYSVKVDEGKAHLFSRTAAAHPDVETPIVSAAIRGT